MLNLYLYNSFDDWTAKQTVQEIDAFEGQPFDVHINTSGGRTAAGIAVIQKLSAAENVGRVIVDGDALSMGAFATVFADEVEANEFSEFMFHKAAYPSWYEASEQELKTQTSFNTLMKKAMLKKGIDADFVEEVFEEGARKDLFLTAKEALKKGVITKLNKIGKIAFDETLSTHRKAATKAAYKRAQGGEQNPATPQTPKKMNADELRAQHPAACELLVKEAVAKATLDERNRAGSFLAHLKTPDKSAAAVAVAAIKAGDDYMVKFAELNQLQMAEMQAKHAEAENMGDIEGDPETPAADKDKSKNPAKTAYAQDEAAVFKHMGLTPKA